MPHETVLADGSFDFTGGVNSQAVTTLRSELVPHGLRRDQLAWLSNATVRGGAIRSRTGWFKLFDLLTSGLWQGGIMYEPIVDGPPYGIFSVSGRIYKILYDAPFTVTDLSAQFGLTNPPNVDQAFFCEGEGILVIQAGDKLTLPLFYNSAFGAVAENLVRSNGLTGNLVNPQISQLPAALMMVYYAQRIWYAQDRLITAGDIAGNTSSGTLPWKFADSIVSVTENPLAFGGDGFKLPSQAGNIRALAYTANLDTALGQGPLYIFSRKQVYSLNVPVTRADWIAASTSNTPLLTVAQINNGAVGERGVVHINGDLFYQSIDPSIRSLIVATRYYNQWGNVPISDNVIRALAFNDRSILRFASSSEFDNRLLNGVLPKVSPRGVVCQGLLPLNFDTVSTLEEREPPAWEGMWDGLDILQTFSGDFGGRPRAFAVTVSRDDESIDVWELSDSLRRENGDNRIQWYAEFPAFTWGKEFELKTLLGGEIWIDSVSGEVDLTVEYRPDASACWILWHKVRFCTTRNCQEDVDNPTCYPESPNYREGEKFPITLPKPPAKCEVSNKRMSNKGFQFQPKITIKGWCRIRGIILYSEIKHEGLYEGLNC